MNNRSKRIVSLLALAVILNSTPLMAEDSSSTSTTTPTQNTTTDSNPKLYSDFDLDVRQIAERADSKIFPVDIAKKQALIMRLKNFAKDLGINLDNAKTDTEGRLYQSVKSGAEVDRYFSYTQPDDDLGVTSEVIAIRKAWGRKTGSPNVLTPQEIKSLVTAKRSQFGVPVVDSNDTAYATPPTQLRMAGGNDEPTTVLRQSVGFYRKLGERQVKNSTLHVDLDNATKTVSGLSLKSWWPLTAPHTGELKSFEQLKSDILNELPAATSPESTTEVRSCAPIYYQLKQNLIPAIDCTFVVKSNGQIRQHSSVTVSQTNQYSLVFPEPTPVEFHINTGTVTAVEQDPDRTYTVDDTDLPPDMGDTSGDRFAATYDADADIEDFLYAGAKKFYDKFGETWSDASLFADNPEDYVNDTENGTLARVENYDFVFHFGHGLITSLEFFDSSSQIDGLHLNISAAFLELVSGELLVLSSVYFDKLDRAAEISTALSPW